VGSLFIRSWLVEPQSLSCKTGLYKQRTARPASLARSPFKIPFVLVFLCSFLNLILRTWLHDYLEHSRRFSSLFSRDGNPLYLHPLEPGKEFISFSLENLTISSFGFEFLLIYLLILFLPPGGDTRKGNSPRGSSFVLFNRSEFLGRPRSQRSKGICASKSLFL